MSRKPFEPLGAKDVSGTMGGIVSVEFANAAIAQDKAYHENMDRIATLAIETGNAVSQHLKEERDALKEHLAASRAACAKNAEQLLACAEENQELREWKFNACKLGNHLKEELDAAKSRVTALEEVAGWAQACLHSLNGGGIEQNSPLHLKLREVMINYRTKGEPEVKDS